MAKRQVKIDGEVSDHDLLIRIDERLQKVDACLSNHLHRHWRVTVIALTVAAGAVGAAIMHTLF